MPGAGFSRRPSRRVSPPSTATRSHRAPTRSRTTGLTARRSFRLDFTREGSPVTSCQWGRSHQRPHHPHHHHHHHHPHHLFGLVQSIALSLSLAAWSDRPDSPRRRLIVTITRDALNLEVWTSSIINIDSTVQNMALKRNAVRVMINTHLFVTRVKPEQGYCLSGVTLQFLNINFLQKFTFMDIHISIKCGVKRKHFKYI